MHRSGASAPSVHPSIVLAPACGRCGHRDGRRQRGFGQFARPAFSPEGRQFIARGYELPPLRAEDGLGKPNQVLATWSESKRSAMLMAPRTSRSPPARRPAATAPMLPALVGAPWSRSDAGAVAKASLEGPLSAADATAVLVLKPEVASVPDVMLVMISA